MGNDLSNRVWKRVRSKSPGGVGNYGFSPEAISRQHPSMMGLKNAGRRDEIDERDPTEQIIWNTLNDGNEHIVGATWCGACNMQKSVNSGKLPIKDKKGKQMWVDRDGLQKSLENAKSDKEREQIKYLLEHIVPEGTDKKVVFHYIDDPDPKKREIANLLADTFQLDGYPGHLKHPNVCDWKKDPKACRETGVKFRGELVSFIETNAKKV